jgi:hypothetical protein
VPRRLASAMSGHVAFAVMLREVAQDLGQR